MRRFSVEDYHTMIRTGILTEDDPLELLEGLLVVRPPSTPQHEATVGIVDARLRNRLPEGWQIRIKSGVTLSESEPEPDLAIVRGPARRYMDHHPGPDEITLLVEVADSTLWSDQQDKGRIYARAGIVTYWVVNLVGWQIEVYTDPTGPGAAPRYRQQQTYDRNDDVPLVIDGVTVGYMPVRELLP